MFDVEYCSTEDHRELDANHNFFVMVDNATRDQFGGEIGFRSALERELTGDNTPIVMIVIQGGPNTIAFVLAVSACFFLLSSPCNPPLSLFSLAPRTWQSCILVLFQHRPRRRSQRHSACCSQWHWAGCRPDLLRLGVPAQLWVRGHSLLSSFSPSALCLNIPHIETCRASPGRERARSYTMVELRSKITNCFPSVNVDDVVQHLLECVDDKDRVSIAHIAHIAHIAPLHLLLRLSSTACILRSFLHYPCEHLLLSFPL
jgi:hypothetical protein